jgi:hypothetical protein
MLVKYLIGIAREQSGQMGVFRVYSEMFESCVLRNEGKPEAELSERVGGREHTVVLNLFITLLCLGNAEKDL